MSRNFGRFDRTKTKSIGNRVRQRIKARTAVNCYVCEFFLRYQNEVLELKKPSTQKQWKKCHLDMIEDFGYLKMDNLDRQTIQMFFTNLSKRVEPATVVKYWVSLSAVLNYAVEEGIIEGFDKPKLPKVYKSQQQWVDIDQMREFIQRSTGTLKVMFMLLIETGCRIGEALGLQTEDLNIKDKTLSINRTIYDGRPNAPKTQSSYRTIAISDELCYALDTIRSKVKAPAYIFRTVSGKPIRPSFLMKKFNKVYDRIGAKRVGFHALRRGNITHLILNLEIPESIVGQRVGHLSNGMTLGVYVQRIHGLDRKWVPIIAESIYGGRNAIRSDNKI